MRLFPFLFLLSWTAGSLRAAVLNGHARDVNAVACAAGGSLLASGGEDGAVVLWSAAKREKTGESKGDAVLAVAVSDDGKWAAAGERYNKVRLMNTGAGTTKFLEGHTSAVVGIQFVAGGKLASIARDGNIRVWDAATGAAQPSAQRIPDSLDAAAFTADGKLAVGGAGGAVYLHNLALKKLAWKSPQAVNAKAVAITADGRVVAAGLNNSTVVLLDGATGKEAGRIEGVDANGLAFSADGASLAAAGHDNQVHLINVATRKVTAVYKGHGRTVRGVCILTATPQVVVSGSADMTVRLFPME